MKCKSLKKNTKLGKTITIIPLIVILKPIFYLKTPI